jgi:polysaccharide deacetylase family protein (PEP-CTERM system associated)
MTDLMPAPSGTDAATAVATGTTHIFSVDVEEHFQVTAFEGVVSRGSWDRQPSRVERSTGELLELLARHGVRGTFFTLGWVARSHPWLVKRIAAAGHEVASHGYSHRRLSTMTPKQVREELRDSKASLEDVTGRAVYGFRAPSFSILPGGEWAFDLLLEEGYRYDSSLFPIHRPDYGYPSAPTAPHLIRRPSGALLELPLATLRLGSMRIPAAGGGYLRQFPFELVRRAFRQHGRRGVPGMFYIHPWELDVDQPRLPCSLATRMRHYGGLRRTRPRIERLLREFRFTSVAERYGMADGANGRPQAWDPASLALPA